MSTSQRALRVARQLHRELSELLRTEVKDPRVGHLTITEVEVSPDLGHARAFYCPFGGGEPGRDLIRGLRRASPFLRAELAHRMRMRVVPELEFVYDNSIDRGVRLSRLIDEAVGADGQDTRTEGEE